jgi:hypothetical protein
VPGLNSGCVTLGKALVLSVSQMSLSMTRTITGTTLKKLAVYKMTQTYVGTRSSPWHTPRIRSVSDVILDVIKDGAAWVSFLI